MDSLKLWGCWCACLVYFIFIKRCCHVFFLIFWVLVSKQWDNSAAKEMEECCDASITSTNVEAMSIGNVTFFIFGIRELNSDLTCYLFISMVSPLKASVSHAIVQSLVSSFQSLINSFLLNFQFSCKEYIKSSFFPKPQIYAIMANGLWLQK